MSADRKPERKAWQRWLLGLLFLGSYAACVAGFLAWKGQYGWEYWSEALYQSARIFGFEYDGPRPPESVPFLLHAGRLGAMVSIFLLGWLTADALLRERLTPLRLLFRSPEVLFCGITAASMRVALARKTAFPGVRQALLAENVSADLVQRFSTEVSRLVLLGNPASRSSLKRASIRTGTRTLYASGATDTETMAIVTAVLEHLQENPASASHLKLAVLLRDRALQQTVDAALLHPALKDVELAWLDPVAIAARICLDRVPPDALTPPPGRIHVLLWGSTPLIEALLLQLARNVYPRPGLTLVTVIAPAIFRQQLLDRYPALAPDFRDAQLFASLHPFIEINWLDREAATFSVEDLAAIERQAPLSCAYVDGGADAVTWVTSRRLLQLRTRTASGFAVAAFLDEARERDGLVVIAADRDVYRYQPGEQYLGQRLDVLAMLHNFAYQPGNVIPDFEAPTLEQAAAWHDAWAQWMQAPEWKRQSSRYVADHIAIKLRSLGLARYLDPSHNGIDAARGLRERLIASLPELGALEHLRFCAERMLEGWLPVSEVIWTPGEPEEGLDGYREKLKALRLNPTLAIKVDKPEMQKDERLVAALPWMLWILAHPPASGLFSVRREADQSSS